MLIVKEKNTAIESTVKESFIKFCNQRSKKKKIEPNEFDILHDFRNWVINDLTYMDVLGNKTLLSEGT